MKKIPVALQLWSVREHYRKDFAATVAAVARMGYAGVEIVDYGNLDAKAAKAAVDAAGLRVAGLHVNIAQLRADLNTVISDALLFGTRHVVCPSWPRAQFVSAAAFQNIGGQLDAIGAVLRGFGLQFGFHNHADELRIFDGRPGFDWMLGAAQPRNLAAEPDVYWIQHGGYSPVKFLRDHGARCPLVHLKDEAELGRGPVDFPAVFAAIDDIGAAEWLVVEQEKYNHPPMESVRLCFEQMKAWGRV